ncbi:unnamed protein product [Urochloa humidicola]
MSEIILASDGLPSKVPSSDYHTLILQRPELPTMAEATTTKHVVLFPFPGQGHLSAFVSLAGLLHRALPDAAITLVSTPCNVAALRDADTSASPFLSLHALPFTPAEHGLPPRCESVDALPPGRIMELMEAFEALQPAFDGYLAAATATASVGGARVIVVSDPFTAWTVTVARLHGCTHAVFASCGAFGSAVLHSLWSHLPVRPDPATGRVHLPEHPELVIHRSQVSKHVLLAAEAGGKDRGTVFLQRQISFGSETDAVLVNTVEEFEPTGLAMLRRAVKVPVCPIGPLVRAAESRTGSPETAAAIESFLDGHPRSSVLYISFGSQNSILAEQMVELAAALELTGRPFIWAIRPPVEHDTIGEFRAEWLPEGFEERARASNRGLLVRGWAPQLRILAHASTGAFLSHCGWNSVLESMAHGVPIIGWPLSGEQFYNAKMLDEEWGVCVEVARGNMEEDTAVEREAVAGVLETVMGQTAKAEEMRKQVCKIREMMETSWGEEGGSSRKVALEEFLRTMKLR